MHSGLVKAELSTGCGFFQAGDATVAGAVDAFEAEKKFFGVIGLLG